MFGSVDDALWEWEGSSSTWLARKPNVRPSIRKGQAMAYDASRKMVLLFGGTSGRNLLGDTWEWDGVGGQWLAHPNLTSAPAPRVGHAMAYDAIRKKVVLFGGRDDTQALDDTWEWDGSTGTWSRREVVAPPPKRSGHAMAFDVQLGRVVLLGGSSTSGALGDFWEWNSAAKVWTQLQPTSTQAPSGRWGAGLVYDNSVRRLVMFGGSPSVNTVSDDTWEWEGATKTWTKRNISAPPLARFDHGLAYDSARKRIVLFGGWNNQARELDDTWEY